MEPGYEISKPEGNGLFIIVANYPPKEISHWHFINEREAMFEKSEHDIGIWKPKTIK